MALQMLRNIADMFQAEFEFYPSDQNTHFLGRNLNTLIALHSFYALHLSFLGTLGLY